MENILLIEKREKTHGFWPLNAFVAQDMKVSVKAAPTWKNLTYSQKEAIDLILTKIARMVTGDPDHIDHWDDIAGYATLVSKEIKDVASGSKSLRDGSPLAEDKEQQTT